MLPIDLAGQTALVTGAGRGLGKATATLLHQAGANVVINHFPDETEQQQAQSLAAELGDRALAISADVRDMDQVTAMMQQAGERFGRLDIVVNNAGILRDRTLRKMTLDEWQAVIDTNLTGVFKVCKAAASMLQQGGRIVNLASIAAVVGFFGQSNYAAAKAGVIGMTRVLSRELARREIRVNAVAPGVVLTDMGKTIPQAARDQMLAEIPMGRFGQPEQIASVILFLASDLSSYMTGQTLHVNGGWFG